MCEAAYCCQPPVDRSWGAVTVLLKDRRGFEQYQSMNSSMARRYPRLDSGDLKLLRRRLRRPSGNGLGVTRNQGPGSFGGGT